jgi:hypothetical protein
MINAEVFRIHHLAFRHFGLVCFTGSEPSEEGESAMRRISYQAILGALVSALLLAWAIVPIFGTSSEAATTPITLSSATTVTGGAKLSLLITLTGTTPSNGAEVALSSSNSAISVPARVTIPVGKFSLTLPVSTIAVAANRSTTISALYHGVTVTRVVVVKAPTLSSLTLSSLVTPGKNVRITVGLSSVAASAGALVKLTSDHPEVLTLPTSVKVLGGTSSISVLVPTKGDAGQLSYNITATMGTKSVTKMTTVGLVYPTATTAAPTKTPTPKGTATPKPTSTATNTPRAATPTKTATPLPTSTNTPKPPTATATATKTATPKPTSTATNTPVNTATTSPTKAPTNTPTATATNIPDAIPAVISITAQTPGTTSFTVGDSNWYDVCFSGTRQTSETVLVSLVATNGGHGNLNKASFSVPSDLAGGSVCTAIQVTGTTVGNLSLSAKAADNSPSPATSSEITFAAEVTGGQFAITQTDGTAPFVVGNTVTFHVCYTGTLVSGDGMNFASSNTSVATVSLAAKDITTSPTCADVVMTGVGEGSAMLNVTNESGLASPLSSDPITFGPAT